MHEYSRCAGSAAHTDAADGDATLVGGRSATLCLSISVTREPMSYAIRVHAVGGPDAMVYEEVAVGNPGPGEARVRHTAIGINFIDTYHRSGLYALPLPTGIGSEAAGVVEAVGSGADWVKPGDRVAYSGGAPGAYASERVMSADRLVKLPDGIDDRTAATLMLKGFTVQYLFRQ